VDDKANGPKAPEIEIAAERLAERSSVTDGRSRNAKPRGRRGRPALLLGGVAALVGLASLATSVWVYSEMQREMLRISTEMAQLRLSLDLYAQRSGAAPAATSVAAPADSSALADLQNRLSILERNWRGGAAGAQPSAALPAIGGPTVSTESDGDCLPSGMRLLVAAGDTYPICGTDAVIEVMNVSDGYISLTDGTTVPSGGTAPLSGTACLIAVTSGGDESVTGFAEIRVSC
jgi:hypothetical protein